MNVFDYVGAPAEVTKLLNEKIRRRMYFGGKFQGLIGANFLKKMGRGDEVSALAPGKKVSFVGAPVEVVNGFIEQGRIDMLIPVLSRLTGDPVYGDKALEGTEEGNILSTRSVSINRMRKAYARSTGMSYQTIKMWAKQYVKDGEAQLTQWFNDTFPGKGLQSAFLYGYSHDLLVSQAGGGRAMDTVSHPNMFVAGQGKVSYAGGRPGTAGYEASCETAINTLAGGGAATEMSVAFIRNLVQEAPALRIRPIVSQSGYDLYPIFINRGGWTQLRQDPELKTYLQALMIGKQIDHPLANLAEVIIDGAAIIVDHKLFTAYTNAENDNVTAGTVEYGHRPTAAQLAKGFKIGDTIDALDQGRYAIAMLFGASALSIATGEEISFHDDMKDYDNVQGMGIDMIKSVVRNETYDTLGQVPGLTKGDFYENTSSLIGITNSPYALSYS